MSCSSPFEQEPVNAGINIYLLQDQQDTSNLNNEPLVNLKLNEKPWIASNNIERYDWSTHTIYLKSAVQLPDNYDNILGKYFVVTANGVPCYVGQFWGYHLSSIPQNPVYNVPSERSEITCLPIDPSIGTLLELAVMDPRYDVRVKQALVSSGLFFAGIDCVLDSVSVLQQSANKTTISYTFSIINQTDKDIFVFDPLKMGTDIFHYYTNGIQFNAGRESIVRGRTDSIDFSPEAYISMDWFVKLGNKEKITRTVTLSGYPEIPEEQYSCYFYYKMPYRLLDMLNVSEGILWTGRIKSSVLSVAVK